MANEFGDYQTPQSLANRVVQLLKTKGFDYENVIEPTFGEGNFVQEVAQQFENVKRIKGIEIQEDLFERTQEKLEKYSNIDFELRNEDFFIQKYENLFDNTKRNLVVGNPPWVTASQLAQMNSSNVPQKGNIKNLSGFDALTGKSNFDIAEWIALRLLEEMSNLTKKSALALLVKNSVIRNIAKYLPSSNLIISRISMYHFDAKKEFNVSTDASLLLIEINDKKWDSKVHEFELSEPLKKINIFGWVENHFVSNIDNYQELIKFDKVTTWDWRSGVKHDIGKVMEFEKISDNLYQNALGEKFCLPDDYVFPLVKSSDISKGTFRKYVLVTQKSVGEDTSIIQEKSPETWEYLENHKEYFDKRKSSIYRNAPEFSVFGIGDYSFKTYKVAVSGMYKIPKFRVLKPVNGKPVMTDDTVYFVGFDKLRDAELFAEVLNSEESQKLLGAITFSDAKRPYTKEILKRVDVIEQLKARKNPPKEIYDFLEKYDDNKYEQLKFAL